MRKLNVEYEEKDVYCIHFPNRAGGYLKYFRDMRNKNSSASSFSGHEIDQEMQC